MLVNCMLVKSLSKKMLCRADDLVEPHSCNARDGFRFSMQSADQLDVHMPGQSDSANSSFTMLRMEPLDLYLEGCR